MHYVYWKLNWKLINVIVEKMNPHLIELGGDSIYIYKVVCHVCFYSVVQWNLSKARVQSTGGGGGGGGLLPQTFQLPPQTLPSCYLILA